MKTCKEISQLLSENQDRQLTWRERWAVRIHISICRSCYRFRDQLAFLHMTAGRFKPKG